jgi:hypothetical protein
MHTLLKLIVAGCAFYLFKNLIVESGRRRQPMAGAIGQIRNPEFVIER